MLDEVVAASRPRLEDDADRTAYELADWPEAELSELADALEREGILHEWTDDGELLVYGSDEERVDALFEELACDGPDGDRIQLDGEELDRPALRRLRGRRQAWPRTPGTPTPSSAPSPAPAGWPTWPPPIGFDELDAGPG